MKNSTLKFIWGGLAAGVAYSLLQPKRGDADRGKRYKGTFDPGAGTTIWEDEAKKHAKKYKEKYKNNTSSNYCNKPIIKSILNHDECVGLRIYRILDTDKDQHGIVLVGVDQHGNDLLPSKQMAANYLIAKSYEKCPENCDGDQLTK